MFEDESILGNYTADSGAAPSEKTKENKLWSNIKAVIYRSNLVFWTVTIFIAVILSLYGIKSKRFVAISKEMFLLYLMFPLSNVLRFLTVMLGDGSHDDRKHFFVLNTEFDIMFVINICLLSYISLYYLKRFIKTKLSA